MMKWLTLALAFLFPMVGMGASANKCYLDAGGGSVSQGLRQYSF